MIKTERSTKPKQTEDNITWTVLNSPTHADRRRRVGALVAAIRAGVDAARAQFESRTAPALDALQKLQDYLDGGAPPAEAIRFAQSYLDQELLCCHEADQLPGLCLNCDAIRERYAVLGREYVHVPTVHSAFTCVGHQAALLDLVRECDDIGESLACIIDQNDVREAAELAASRYLTAQEPSTTKARKRNGKAVAHA